MSTRRLWPMGRTCVRLVRKFTLNDLALVLTIGIVCAMVLGG